MAKAVLKSFYFWNIIKRIKNHSINRIYSLIKYKKSCQINIIVIIRRYKFIFQSMQIRFKIKSFSSQNHAFPISNLLSKHDYWESERFCDYPQQITISFYQPVSISRIQIASHPSKIPSRINILYYLPQNEDTSFKKYGFIQYSQGQSTNFNSLEVKQMKDVDIKASQLRLIILRNHVNKHNFFNQVGIAFLNIFGQNYDHVIPASVPNKSSIFSFDPQINILNQLKGSLIKKQQYEQAKQVKNMLNNIKKATRRLDELEGNKRKCIKDQDFLGAKKIKQEMMKYKLNMSQIIGHFYDPEKSTFKNNKSDVILRQKIQQFDPKLTFSNLSNDSRSMHNKSRMHQIHSDYIQQIQAVSQDEAQQQNENKFQTSTINHEERIVPAILNKIKGMGQTNYIIPEQSQVFDNQFYEDGANKNQLPAEPQPLTPSDQANSSMLNQFHDQSFIKKLHSRHWQFKLEAVNQSLEQAKLPQQKYSKAKIRSLIFIYSKVISSQNYQVAHTALQLMNTISKIKGVTQYKNELHNQLQMAIYLTIKKLNDSNQKIRSQTQKSLFMIIEGQIFGVSLYYHTVVKYYNSKINPKIRKTMIQSIQYMVEKYGLGENGVPISSVQFSLKAINDPDSQVRKNAIKLLKCIKEREGKQKLEELLLNAKFMKPSIAKQILQ